MEIFIEKVKKYPCLWDTNSISYRDIGRKETAWKNVSRQCGLSNAKEAKLQWKRLRDSRREALRRRKTITGQSTNNKPWKYDKLMEFLQPQSNTETSSNYTNSDETESNTQVDAVEDDEIQEEIPIVIKTQSNEDLADILQQRERRLEQRQTERDELPIQALDGNRLIQQQDAMMSLFTSMCEKTKALPKYLQLRVQREVFEAVTRAEEEALSLDINEYGY